MHPSDKQEVEELARNVQGFIEEQGRYVDAVSKVNWKPGDGFLGLVYRSILRRQQDALATIVELTLNGRGHSAMTLLRPSCEELIWVKYLRKIDEQVAERIVTLLGPVELYKTLNAQQGYFGKKWMRQLDIPDAYVEEVNQNKITAEKELESIGQTLNWNLKPGQYLPSVAFMAKKTESKKLYNYLYHSTSRTVHFSVSELYRRIWEQPGQPGVWTVRSEHYNKYFSEYSLYWGWRLYVDTHLELGFLFPDEEPEGFNADRLLESGKYIGQRGQMPIVTAYELNLKQPKRGG